MKLQQEIDRPGSARNNRFANLAVGAEQSETFPYQRRTPQVVDAVFFLSEGLAHVNLIFLVGTFGAFLRQSIVYQEIFDWRRSDQEQN